MNYRGAIEDCSSAIELDYRDPSVFNARAMGYRGLGLYDHAIEDLSVSHDANLSRCDTCDDIVSF
jgi:hypothetical protein